MVIKNLYIRSISFWQKYLSIEPLSSRDSFEEADNWINSKTMKQLVLDTISILGSNAFTEKLQTIS